MPKYLVEMHDGRKFQVEADTQPSEADVLSHLGAQSDAKPIGANEPDTFWGGVGKSLKDQFAQAVGPDTSKQDPFIVHGAPPAVEHAMNTPLAHPTGFDAIDGFTSPAGLTTLAAGAAQGLVESPTARGTVGRGLEAIGDFDFRKPFKSTIGRVGKALAESADEARMNPPRTMAQVTGTTPAPPRIEMPEPAPAMANTALSDADRTLLAKKYPGLDPAKVEQQLTGRLQMAPTDRPPITVSPESPMQPPRAQVGAEVVGRQNGMSTQQVRDATGPIRGEAPGAAAGMPSTPKDRIVEKLIDMGPKGQGLPESAREAYAAAGTSDKTRLQVQAYLDALRKVGYVGAGAAGADAIRRAVMERLGRTEQ